MSEGYPQQGVTNMSRPRFHIQNYDGRDCLCDDRNAFGGPGPAWAQQQVVDALNKLDEQYPETHASKLYQLLKDLRPDLRLQGR